MWEKAKALFSGRKKEEGQDLADIRWVEAADNPWGVAVLDVRPVTLNMLSTSASPECAQNAVSFGQDDGTGFIGEQPPDGRIVEASLHFPIDRMLAAGVLFVPREMEHKWALFYHAEQIICVRSWTRTVQLLARCKQAQDHLEITEVHGTFGQEHEQPELTLRLLDFLLRSHALELVHPTPLPPGMDKDPARAAMWCMSMFGNRAWFATPHPVAAGAPERPLRTHSMLHIAVARADRSAIDRALASGTPVDLLAADGLAPLHWAMAPKDLGIVRLLLERGSSVDVRSDEGATPLMNAVQGASLEVMRFLLDRGADVNAHDARGFTALHRAAEMNFLDLVRELLVRGAEPNPQTAEQTPRALAEARGNVEAVKLLDLHIKGVR